MCPTPGSRAHSGHWAAVEKSWAWESVPVLGLQPEPLPLCLVLRGGAGRIGSAWLPAKPGRCGRCFCHMRIRSSLTGNTGTHTSLCSLLTVSTSFPSHHLLLGVCALSLMGPFSLDCPNQLPLSPSPPGGPCPLPGGARVEAARFLDFACFL